MKLTEKLTQFQEMALRGEVAYALSTASHDADIKYRVFMILREVEEECRPLIVEVVKELITFDEKEIDKIYLEVLNGSIPVWLWIEKIIADIRESVLLGKVQGNNLNLHIDRKEARLKLLESAFTLFVRKAILVSQDAAKQLLNEILDCSDLEFLHTVCFSLIPACDELRDMGIGKETSSNILDCLLDIREIMSYRDETKALKILDKSQKDIKNSFSKKQLSNDLNLKPNNVATPAGTSSKCLTEDISQLISDQVQKLFGNDFNGVKFSDVSIRITEVQPVFVVRKTFKTSGIYTDLQKFNTKEEALKYKQQIEQEFPELLNSCTFEVITITKEIS